MRSRQTSKQQLLDNERSRSASRDGADTKLQIFSTVDDSPFVVCVPPTATTQIGYKS